MIEVKGLTKRYATGRAAVDALTFTIEKGHIYGLLGLNGAGKSTTLNLITGALSPTEGEISICGHDLLTDPAPAKACIGYLPENPPLYGDLTPDEYLTFVGRAKGIPKKDLALSVKKALNATGTYPVHDKLISTLSKGYKQRIGIAQAMLGQPQILILDEPTVGLDPGQVIELRKLILSLGKDHTVILSSHILSEIAEVCDRILILSEGRLVVDDTLSGLQKLCPTSDMLELTVAVPEERAREILTKVPSIVSAVYESDGNRCNIRLTVASGKDIREAVFFAFASAHRAILSMSLRQVTLEDIFLRVISERVEKSASTPKKGRKQRQSPPKNPDPPAKKKKITLFTERQEEKNDSDEDDGDDYRPLFH